MTATKENNTTKLCKLDFCIKEVHAKKMCAAHLWQHNNGKELKPTRFREKHGLGKSIEYNTWHSMKQRCTNPKNTNYKNYGAKGISICDRWLESFANFYKDMGNRPDVTYTLDRVDNRKGYSPDNCRWATPYQQIVNRGANRNNTVGYRGVKKEYKKYGAFICVDYKNYCVAWTRTKKEAAYIYDQAVMQIHGDEAMTNFNWSTS